MKRAVGASVLVLVLLTAGCSKSDSSKGDDTGSAATTSAMTAEKSTTTTIGPLTTAELTPMLLTVNDLPPGWSVDNSPSNGDDSGTPKCFQDLEKIGTDDPATEAEAEFQKGSQGIPALAEQLTGMLTKSDFDAAVAALNGCTDISFESDGQTYTGSMGQLSTPTVGDQSAAWRMSFEVQAISFTFEFSMTRVGQVGVLVAVADLGGVGEGLLDTMTAKAVAKVSSSA